jgi:hypothetical protein
MINERSIINALIIGAALVFVPFLISSTLTIDYAPALAIGLLGGTALAFFFLRDTLCMWPLLGISISGSLNFLPIPLRAMHVFLILLFLYYITAYVAIRQKRVKLGNLSILVPILVVAAIVFYHNHNLGVKALGGKTEGGRPAILLLIAVFAYFCGINVSAPSVSFLKRIPIYCVILAAVSSIPFLLTTVIPSLAPYVYYITDNVNVGAYFESQSMESTEDEGIGRFAVFGSLGTTLQLYLLAKYPMATWLRPNRWWVAFLSLFCVGCTVISGFRSVFSSFFWTVLVASFCYYSWKSLLLPIVLVLGLLLFTVGSTDRIIALPLDKLPLIAQRTLSFLPGDWSDEALESAKTSNFFRQNIINVYMREDFWKSPWIGNGYDIDRDEYDRLNDAMKDGTEPDQDYIQAKLFITGKLFHTGWLSAYDLVGFVGCAAFVWLALTEIWLSMHFIFGRNADRSSPLFPLYVWIATSVTTQVITFFTVFGDFSSTFSSLCVYGIALSQLHDIEKENAGVTVVVLPTSKRPIEIAGGRPVLSGYPRG